MIELLTPAEMAEADRLAIDAGISGIELMENAGHAVADAAARLYPHGAPQVRVVAGPGNNGGDGFVAARILADRGFPVRVLLLGDRAKLRGDAAAAAGRWQGPTDPATPHGLEGAGLVVDALFGAGLDRPVEGEARAMIEAMNASGAPILAVDLPSGIHGSSGEVLAIAVRATRTTTFFRRKPGHLLLPGRLFCGPVEVADIGIPDSVLDSVKPRIFANEPKPLERRFPGSQDRLAQIQARSCRCCVGRIGFNRGGAACRSGSFESRGGSGDDRHPGGGASRQRGSEPVHHGAPSR